MISDRAQEPEPAPEPAQLPSGFPADPERVEHVRSLGGTTGAELVRDPATGKMYVRKRGASPDHIREECAADAAYQALGVKVPQFELYETPAGPVNLNVPGGSKQGTTLRLKGRGIPTKTPGDLYVVLQIALPPADSDAAKRAYEAMRDALDFNPRAGLGV